MKTKKEYRVHFKVAESDHGILTIPEGTRVTHTTACGPDPDYHFVDDFSWVGTHPSGVPKHGLLHDLAHYGINVPKEYVE